jgi:Na+/melibiose symporter-like transporter
MFALVNGTCVLAMFYVCTIYMQQVLGYNALESGAGLIPLSLIAVASSMLTSPLSARVGFKTVLVVAAGIETVGLLWFSQLSADGSYWSDVFGPTVVIGLGLGATFVAVTIAALQGTDRTNAGLGSGLLNTSQQVGRAIGVAILISVYTSIATDEVSSGTSAAQSLADGLGTGTLVMAGLCLVSALIAAFGIPSQARKGPAAVPA